ncbi:Bax inhibitor-1/YccA family protein [Flavobacterium psychrotrophum]|uniref:Bax inhibitor-1/YccA family protein n=1 Tax=Flavobacterium psychrotrophum TaxID=2294119 RepID=UPI000E314275|nr:Bax inhibitor-1/YccA family protein [Flavobacterium psychrotrophum]
MEFKSKNPLLTGKSYEKSGQQNVYSVDGSHIIDYNDTMTVKGTINKTFILFGLLLVGAVVPFYMALNGINPYIPGIVSLFVALGMVIACTLSPKNAAFLAPAYALFEGVFIGSVSIFFEMMYPGIVLQAVAGTLVTFGVCLALYRFGIVKVTEQFRSIVIGATAAIGTYYLISALFYWIGGVSFFHRGNSLMSIGFSVVVIVIAAMSLILDFDMIDKGVKQRMPKHMEWFSGMGLIVTLVWLYLEFLRLLSKLQSRN